GFALVRFLSATLRDTNHLHTHSLAQLYILLTEETPIRTIQFWDVAEHFLVAFEGRFHVLFIVRVALEHFVLRDQPLDTFGKKNCLCLPFYPNSLIRQRRCDIRALT